MKLSRVLQELLVALIGSSLFWLTLAGMAIRGLKLDFVKLEAYLGRLFSQMDAFTFSAISASDTAIDRTLTTLYGATIVRIFIATALPALALNSYVLTKLRADWLAREHELLATQIHAIEQVSPKYAEIAKSKERKDRLYQVVHGDVPTSEMTADDREAEGLYFNFLFTIDAYLASHDLSYDFNLLHLFARNDQRLDQLAPGDESFSAPFISQAFFLIFGVITTSIIDAAAVKATIALKASVFAGQVRGVAALGAIITSCFLLSTWNYGAFLRGQYAPAVMIPLWLAMTSYALIVPFVLATKRGRMYLGLSNGAEDAEELLAVALTVWLIVVVTMVFKGHSISGWFEIPVSYAKSATATFSAGAGDTVVLVSMPTLFPLVASISILLTMTVAKIVFVTLKSYFLGQIYGASVMSGSTYFLGFLMTIITSTAAAFVLMHFIGASKP